MAAVILGQDFFFFFIWRCLDKFKFRIDAEIRSISQKIV